MAKFTRHYGIDPRWLSLAIACRYSSMSEKTLLKHVRAGHIVGKKDVGKWYVDRISIDAFFQSDSVYVEETLARLLGKVTKL